ncbi:DUF4265 domain-containing protein [Leisingera sp. F5]|uniref:DUF4265 domain-containing protein n=1 Tax=Leisingera sp. F5 TaxID=1813816 RepID=UPI0025BC480C|nr:DUF4265 domain-containing protein [Leisingera sp. F5]
MIIELEQDEWHEYSAESIWVSPVSEGMYRIENIPFLAKGLSFHDVISVKDIDGQLFFDERIVRANHSTYRIIPEKDCSQETLSQCLSAFNAAGCCYEHGDFGFDLYALDIPEDVDVHKVYALLKAGEQEEVWDFEEGDFSHVG